MENVDHVIQTNIPRDSVFHVQVWVVLLSARSLDSVSLSGQAKNTVNFEGDCDNSNTNLWLSLALESKFVQWFLLHNKNNTGFLMSGVKPAKTTARK